MKTWKIDPSHSEIKFKVKHLLVSTVTGQFNDFDAEIEIDTGKFENSKISFKAAASSIDTKNEQRDNHLKSPDFFDFEKFPKLTFVSKNINKISDSEFEVTGDMTIRSITKEITLDVLCSGKAAGLDGLEVAGFEISGNLNRFEFGLKWNSLTEAGGVVVGPEVKIEIFAEMKESANASKAA